MAQTIARCVLSLAICQRTNGPGINSPAGPLMPDNIIIIWSGRTIYDNINGPGGPFMHVDNRSGYNINGPPQVLHGLVFL